MEYLRRPSPGWGNEAKEFLNFHLLEWLKSDNCRKLYRYNNIDLGKGVEEIKKTDAF